jgi:hypothetical protein
VDGRSASCEQGRRAHPARRPNLIRDAALPQALVVPSVLQSPSLPIAPTESPKKLQNRRGGPVAQNRSGRFDTHETARKCKRSNPYYAQPYCCHPGETCADSDLACPKRNQRQATLTDLGQIDLYGNVLPWLGGQSEVAGGSPSCLNSHANRSRDVESGATDVYASRRILPSPRATQAST